MRGRRPEIKNGTINALPGSGAVPETHHQLWDSSMSEHIHMPSGSASEDGRYTFSGVSDIDLSEVDGEPRALDLEVAKRLGFSRDRDVRQLIERNAAELETFGRIARRSAAQLRSNGATHETTEYWLNEEQALLISALSKTERAAAVRAMLIRVFVAWRKGRLAGLAAPSTAEAFASAFMMIAQQERQQAEQQRAIQHLDDRVERVEKSQSVLSARPVNAESITHLRSRIGKMFGLSAAVIDEVMRQSPYAPKPAGMVKNDHVDADGVPYAIYWRKDVTATFARFVDECTPVTATMFTHPFIDGRFRIVGKAVAA